jgi:hypothetical protein
MTPVTPPVPDIDRAREAEMTVKRNPIHSQSARV